MDRENIHISGFDEKNSSEDSEVPSNSLINHSFSKRLLTWGVELRGASHSTYDSELNLREQLRESAL